MTKMPIVTLSFIALIAMTVTFIAYLFGYIRIENAITIVMTSLIIQAVLITILIRKLVKSLHAGGIVSRASISTGVSGGVIIPKGKFDDKYITANSEILSQSVTSTHPWRDGIFRIVMELVPDVENRPLKFYIIRKCPTDACEQEVDIIKPSDSSKHMFELNIDPKELINFKFSRDAIVKSFKVDELYIP